MSPTERSRTIRIRDPKNEEKTVTEVTLKNESMSTSGNYEKFFLAEGKMYSHIMDPRTGFPATGMLSAGTVEKVTMSQAPAGPSKAVLRREGIAMHAPRSYREDIALLTQYSDRTLGVLEGLSDIAQS